MAKIQPTFALYDPEGRLVVIDTRGRVWVYNHNIDPARWVQLTELPQAPASGGSSPTMQAISL